MTSLRIYEDRQGNYGPELTGAWIYSTQSNKYIAICIRSDTKGPV